jgi:hypothetical protein
MRTINQVANGELRWINPTNELAFELRAGDELVGQLQFDAEGRGDSDTAGQRLTFKRQGFWPQRVIVRVPGSGANVAVFRISWKKGGTLELEGRRQLHLRAAIFLRRWDWTDMEGKPLVHLKKSVLGFEGHVTIEPDAVTSPDLPLLVVLGWYLLVLWARDAQND